MVAVRLVDHVEPALSGQDGERALGRQDDAARRRLAGLRGEMRRDDDVGEREQIDRRLVSWMPLPYDTGKAEPAPG